MPIHLGDNPNPSRIYVGDTRIHAVYLGDTRYWQAPSAPVIASFTSSVTSKPLSSFPTSGQDPDLTLTFAVTGSTRNEIHRTTADGVTVNIPLDSNTSTSTQIQRQDAVYTLTCRNAAGDEARASIAVTITIPVAIAYFRQGRHWTSEFGLLHTGQLTLEFSVTGHPRPALSFSSTAGATISNIQWSGSGPGTAHASLRLQPTHQDDTITMHAGSLSRSFTYQWPASLT